MKRKLSGSSSGASNLEGNNERYYLDEQAQPSSSFGLEQSAECSRLGGFILAPHLALSLGMCPGEVIFRSMFYGTPQAPVASGLATQLLKEQERLFCLQSGEGTSSSAQLSEGFSESYILDLMESNALAIQALLDSVEAPPVAVAPAMAAGVVDTMRGGGESSAQELVGDVGAVCRQMPGAPEQGAKDSHGGFILAPDLACSLGMQPGQELRRGMFYGTPWYSVVSGMVNQLLDIREGLFREQELKRKFGGGCGGMGVDCEDTARLIETNGELIRALMASIESPSDDTRSSSVRSAQAAIEIDSGEESVEEELLEQLEDVCRREKEEEIEKMKEKLRLDAIERIEVERESMDLKVAREIWELEHMKELKADVERLKEKIRARAAEELERVIQREKERELKIREEKVERIERARARILEERKVKMFIVRKAEKRRLRKEEGEKSREDRRKAREEELARRYALSKMLEGRVVSALQGADEILRNINEEKENKDRARLEKVARTRALAEEIEAGMRGELAEEREISITIRDLEVELVRVRRLERSREVEEEDGVGAIVTRAELELELGVLKEQEVNLGVELDIVRAHAMNLDKDMWDIRVMPGTTDTEIMGSMSRLRDLTRDRSMTRVRELELEIKISRIKVRERALLERLVSREREQDWG
ncbi:MULTISPECIES: hypothetical protein [Candidatus Ichthyocystis]|uniref:hypothetical protein n=2 Tax=Burkholderiales genera incertae sedis TaxID=224471 RepID=UPI000B81D4C9|nr:MULTISPECIES: hypothetical protein [Ichthyocystis]